jgi:enoyl-CoA hydratase/carnithine racemase
MSTLSDYADKFQFIRFRREDGILEMTLHTDGGPLRWGAGPRDDLMHAFHHIGLDRANRVVILTGTGDEYSGPRPPYETRHFTGVPRPIEWDIGVSRGRALHLNMLGIEVPMIAAVNGPAKRHCEIPLLCDIVLAAEEATFEDTAHYALGNLVPGDGVNVVMTMLLGINRARYMMFTGQLLTAQDAKQLGLVGEVLPRDRLLPRAWELARQLTARPELQTRYTRKILVEPLRRAMQDYHSLGMSLEALADIDRAMSEQQAPKAG